MRNGVPSGVGWRKSSRSSGDNADCVEMAVAEGEILVRDSKDPGGPVLTFAAEAWRAFLAQVREDRFG